MANVKISGFPTPIALPQATLANGSEVIPVDQTISGSLKTVGITMAKLLGPISIVSYTTGGIAIAAPSAARAALAITGNASAAAFNITSTTGGTEINWTDGTVTGQLNTNATQSQFGNSSSHALSFFTNNITRVNIDNVGSVSINAPSSAVDALTITAASAAENTKFNTTLSTDVLQVGFYLAGTSKAFIGVAGSNGQLITPSIAGDFLFRTQGGKILMSTNSGTSSQFTIDGGGLVTIASPTTSSTTLTVSGNTTNTFVENLVAGSANMTVALLLLSGGASSAGVETIRMNNCATTGTGTATFTATNKPTATAGGPVTWVPINLDGTRRYIPVWA